MSSPLRVIPLAPRLSRLLTQDERAYADEIFKGSIRNLDQVRIVRGSWGSLGSERTIGYSIHLMDNSFGNGGELNEFGRRNLIHELAHVWQYQQTGIAYIVNSLSAQGIAALRHPFTLGSRNDAYTWKPLAIDKVPFWQWNPEQQAKMVEEYNIAYRNVQGGTASAEDRDTIDKAASYIEEVRNGVRLPKWKYDSTEGHEGTPWAPPERYHGLLDQREPQPVQTPVQLVRWPDWKSASPVTLAAAAANNARWTAHVAGHTAQELSRYLVDAENSRLSAMLATEAAEQAARLEQVGEHISSGESALRAIMAAEHATEAVQHMPLTTYAANQVALAYNESMRNAERAGASISRTSAAGQAANIWAQHLQQQQAYHVQSWQMITNSMHQ